MLFQQTPEAPYDFHISGRQTAAIILVLVLFLLLVAAAFLVAVGWHKVRENEALVVIRRGYYRKVIYYSRQFLGYRYVMPLFTTTETFYAGEMPVDPEPQEMTTADGVTLAADASFRYRIVNFLAWARDIQQGQQEAALSRVVLNAIRELISTLTVAEVLSAPSFDQQLHDHVNDRVYGNLRSRDGDLMVTISVVTLEKLRPQGRSADILAMPAVADAETRHMLLRLEQMGGITIQLMAILRLLNPGVSEEVLSRMATDKLPAFLAALAGSSSVVPSG